MQNSQEHLTTMVYARFGGANRVYYGELENREFKEGQEAKHQHLTCKISIDFDSHGLN